MNYEQKYKEALKKAQKELQCCGDLDCDAARQIFRFFPELRESNETFYKWSLISKPDKRLKSTLTQFFNYLEKRGFIKDELVFDTEHQIDTYIEQFNNQNNNDKRI